jgi:hypothetical protein
MNFRETLEKAKECNIDIINLWIADEVESTIGGSDVELNINDFEVACNLVRRAYLKSDYISIQNIVLALLNELEESQKKLEEIDVWELVEHASYY